MKVLDSFFHPCQLGPLTLRNASIRAAAFEGMGKDFTVTDDLINYHKSVAEGGIGMSTVSYVAINKGGLTFGHQLLITKENIKDFQRLTAAIHSGGAKASVQLGHCGLMAPKTYTGKRPIAPSAKFNLYGPTFPRKMKLTDIESIVNDFQKAVEHAVEAGFDAVEIHAGHGYLISQFLSPYTNKRKDKYGGSLENRMRFMKQVLSGIRSVLPKDKALVVKMNTWDGFEGGITKEESILIAKEVEKCGADAIVASGGFVSKKPMYVMRGKMPISVMAHFVTNPIKRMFIKMVGSSLIKSYDFKEGFFLEDAMRIQENINIPVVAIGGLNSAKSINDASGKGFELMAFARALIENPNFINDLKNDLISKSACTSCNYCVAKIYGNSMTCHFNDENIAPKLKKAIDNI